MLFNVQCSVHAMWLFSFICMYISCWIRLVLALFYMFYWCSFFLFIFHFFFSFHHEKKLKINDELLNRLDKLKQLENVTILPWQWISWRKIDFFCLVCLFYVVNLNCLSNVKYLKWRFSASKGYELWSAANWTRCMR